LTAISVIVAGAFPAPEKAAPPRVTRVRARAHSGHRIPTGVGVMHSGQIGRPQFEQETPVSRRGWR
jgi:hypothetical protein